jgi:predicted AAA+ superfamily ATPase
MKRRIEQELTKWKNDERRFPLLLTGARQVGKTYLVKKFSREFFDNVAYISFDNNPRLEKIFESSVEPNELLPALSAEAGVPIDDKTLLIFDEVQIIPRALTALKYFNENRPDIAIIATGSTLGITLHKGAQFPVGKVNRLELYPLTFIEFLWALGEDQLAGLIESNDKNLGVFHDRLNNLLLQYMFVGGMPLPVAEYADSKNFAAVRKIQTEILADYRDDFSKYTTGEFATKLRLLWDNIPTQLSRENKKFLYGAVRAGARARDFEAAIEWLKDSSLVNIVNRITTPAVPLKSYKEFNAFKIYIHDVGLLSALAGITEKIILDNEGIFREFKGSIAEQFACQELVAYGHKPAYWSPENSESEVDFVIQADNGDIVPIEVKSGTNLRARSLKVYTNKYSPKIAVRSSQADYKQTDNLYDVPLYLLSSFIAKIK